MAIAANCLCTYPEQLKFKAEKSIKFLVIRLAICEKIASRIGVVRVAWCSLVLLSTFGFLIGQIDAIILSVLLVAETFRICVRDVEIAAQAISRELESSNPWKWTKADISLAPILLLNNISKPAKLRLVLCVLEVSSAVLSIVVSAGRLGYNKHHFCLAGTWAFSSCQLSSYLFHSMTVIGSALFLLSKGCFLYFLRRIRHRRHGRRLDHSLVFEMYSIAIYQMCLKPRTSVYDALDMNLVVFAMEWLQSNKWELQLRGAKLLNNLFEEWAVAKSKLNSETGDAVRKLGAYPGLMERLVEVLCWDNEDEDEDRDQLSDEDRDKLSDETISLICKLVASDLNCSTFADVPGALDAVIALIMRRIEQPSDVENGTQAQDQQADRHADRANCRKTCFRVLDFLASNASISARALHEPIATFRCVIRGDPRVECAADVNETGMTHGQTPHDFRRSTPEDVVNVESESPSRRRHMSNRESIRTEPERSTVF